MLLEILRTFKRLAAELALVWLQRNMDANVGGDVVTLDGGSATATPLAHKVEVVCALAANVSFADVILKAKTSA